MPTVQVETVADVGQRLASVGARGAEVALGFGATRALEALESAGVICLQAPVAMPELQRACLEARAPGRRTRAIGGAGPQASAPRYNAEPPGRTRFLRKCVLREGGSACQRRTSSTS